MNDTSADFRRAKTNQWQTIGGPAQNPPSSLLSPQSDDQTAADAIIASAAAESTARYLEDEDTPSPTIIADEKKTGPSSKSKMESGAHAGLQTAAQVSAQLMRKQAEERARFLKEGDAHIGKGTETIYRDASGRIINVAMKRAEARKKAEEDEAKAAAEIEAQKGDVQRAERHRRREELADAKFLPVARYADDVEMNEELKDVERWDDPAAQFLSKKKGGKSVSGKPLYTGPAMPNRYGIRPGHRWDGVDRGNRFEKDYFAAKNRRSNLKDLDYAWQMDE